MQRIISAALVLFALSLSNVARAGASVLYGLEYNLGRLLQVNQSNGVATAIGPIAPAGLLRDLATDTRPDSFRIWANNYDQGQLWRLNPTTGAGTLVGSFGLPSGSFIRTLAFDVSTGKLYGTSDPTSSLYEINPNTGAATLVGPVGLTGLGGLGADAAGNLYALDEPTHGLYRLNTATGAPTLVTALTMTLVSDLAFRPEDGALFISTYSSLYTLDLQSLSSTKVGDAGATISSQTGLAFGPAVPEPRAVAAIALAAAALLGRRPRGRAAHAGLGASGDDAGFPTA